MYFESIKNICKYFILLWIHVSKLIPYVVFIITHKQDVKEKEQHFFCHHDTNKPIWKENGVKRKIIFRFLRMWCVVVASQSTWVPNSGEGDDLESEFFSNGFMTNAERPAVTNPGTLENLIGVYRHNRRRC